MSQRPTRTDVLVETALLWAQRSTCDRLHVGCVIHTDGRILVQGYNGAPAGLPHCNHECNCVQIYSMGELRHQADCPVQSKFCQAVHAEQSAIAWAARTGVVLDGSDMVCTHQPCLSCARSIINAGIVEVLYIHPYRLKDGVDLLERAGVKVTRWVNEDQAHVIGSIL